jgi:hypothetical protein
MGIVTKHRRKRGTGEDVKLTGKGLKVAEALKKFVSEATEVYSDD